MNQQRRQTIRSSVRILMLAFVLALVMAVELAAGNGFLKSLIAGSLPWQAMAMVLMMTVLATFAIVNAFTATMRPDPKRVAGTLASCALALVAGLEASHAVADLPNKFYFWASLGAQILYTHCVALFMIGSVKVTGRAAKAPIYAVTLFVAVAGLSGFVGQSWISLERVVLFLSIFRDVGLALVPVAIVGAVTLYRPLRLDPKSAVESLRLRLPLGPDQSSTRRSLAIMSAGSVAALIWQAMAFASSETLEPGQGAAPLTVFAWTWIGVAYLSVAELAQFTGEERHGQATARLAPTAARRFLKRHLTDKQAWATTVGLKTTNFIIDHDPGGVLHSELPASIMQIRAEEIQRCVTEVLGSMYLHSHVVGARIFGAVDPETAVRPCVDTLRMFACLYLDAGPLVERRIKGLTALLPIVDPGLATVMRLKDVGSLIRRNLWFFHFDFNWIDQHVIHTPRSTRYDVRLAALGSKVRHSMMDYLEKTGGVGNFVWLGPDARDRLLQEAPSLRNIIEACPIVTPEKGAAQETLMFTIKFEHLIPRLQRYFDLDTLRQVLLDFEPSPESARLLSLLGLQINKAHTGEEVADVLSSLTSVPWRGFKEKDHALQLILAAHAQIIRLTDSGGSLAAADDDRTRALHDRLVEAVRMVGYPSQILHHAQVSKIALRDAQVLTSVASDPTHPRFPEAWLLMATADYGRYRPDQRRVLVDFLANLSENPFISRERLVQVKAIDALTGLGRAAGPGEQEAIDKAIDRFADWLVVHEVDLDICCLYLDSQAFIASQFGHGLNLGDAAVKRLDAYFRRLSLELGQNHPKVIAIMSRWQDIRGRKLKAAG